jgi:MinD superfamily P-loop ATPase
MKQLVVLSGKGGTGKTSLTAALSHLAAGDHGARSVVLVDSDVDAPNLELVLAPQMVEREDFWGGQVARINHEACLQTGGCLEVCRFDAIHREDGELQVDPIACEGCAACAFSCPTGAITMEEEVAGEWFRSESRFGPLFHANLKPAKENSGKLVTLLRGQARQMASQHAFDLVMVDGPPGIGCPVIAAVSGVDLALIVTEPSLTGIHDLKRILETTEHFGIRSLVCINKADINPDGAGEIEAFCESRGVKLIGAIPFDLSVTEAMAQGQPVTAFRPHGEASQAIARIWDRTWAILKETEEFTILIE